jgi:hypothetical protein
LISGRLELVVNTVAGLNPCCLRDVKTGRVYADGDYVWPGDDRPQLEKKPERIRDSKGGEILRFSGRLGSLAVEQTFTAPANESGVILEQITVRNPTQQSLDAKDFRCGFSKRIRNGEEWSPEAEAFRFCPVPYRRETDGKLQEFPLREIAEHGTAYGGWEMIASQQPPHQTPAWGAEGWVWSQGTASFLIAKHNPDAMEWSLMEPIKRASDTAVRFGGAGQWKYGHPEGVSRLEPGQSFTFGETRYQVVDGDWKQAYYAYRRHMDGKGCGIRKNYDPPVHWNELFDNEYFFKAGPICRLGVYSAEANQKLLQELYTLDQMKAEAAKAKSLGCQSLYLDPGWDIGASQHIWDAARLGSMESFVKMLKDDYGLRVSLWIGLGGVPPTFADPDACPVEAQVVDQDGHRTQVHCVSSPAFLETKTERLLEVCRRGVAFLMFDSTQYSGPCYDKSHGHSVPSTREEHAKSLLTLVQRVKEKYPQTLIEVHDLITGPCGIHYTPTYFGYAGANSFDCLWGHEFMWNSLDDLLSGRAKSLYYYNLAYSIPLYLHVSLKQDNENALVFWWYASVCRHLGVGGKPDSPAVWEADRQAMQTYLSLKPFYARGIFYGLDETVHAHTLPDVHQSVVNVFNLEETPAQKQVRWRLSEIGLPSGTVQVENATFRQDGDEVVLNMSIPPCGHQWVKVSVTSESEKPEQ